MLESCQFLEGPLNVALQSMSKESSSSLVAIIFCEPSSCRAQVKASVVHTYSQQLSTAPLDGINKEHPAHHHSIRCCLLQ